MDKFYVLTTKQKGDSAVRTSEHASVHYRRSKIFETREDAEAKAKEWLKEGRNSKYYILESSAVVEKGPEFQVTDFDDADESYD